MTNEDFEIGISLKTKEGLEEYLSNKNIDELKELLTIFETFEEYEKCAVIKTKLDEFE